MSREKRRQILTGARDVFRELGFERASVDAIAARAGVSKATVYHHFEDKKALFVAAVVEECEALRDGIRGCAERPVGDVEEVLQRLGERILGIFLSPPTASVFRQAIAVSAHLPEIGRLVYERGTRAIQETVEAHLVRLHDAGALHVDDPRGSAVAFVALVQGDLAARSRLGLIDQPAESEVRETVRRAARIFLKAFRPDGA